MVYFVVGTSPRSDFTDTIEHILANLLYANYDQTITGVALTDILWEQYWDGYKDYAVYFRQVGDFMMDADLGWATQDYDHYTNIQVFVRSTKIDYAHSAEKTLMAFERWIKKVIRQNATALMTQGIMIMEYQDSRLLNMDEVNDDMQSIIIPIKCQYRITNG